jgi:hypothetical protein
LCPEIGQAGRADRDGPSSGASNGRAHAFAEAPAPLWNLYETGLALVSISYGGTSKYPRPAAAARPPPIAVKGGTARLVGLIAQCVRASAIPARDIARSKPVLDVILLGLGLGFFALSIAYALACERL